MLFIIMVCLTVGLASGNQANGSMARNLTCGALGNSPILKPDSFENTIKETQLAGSECTVGRNVSKRRRGRRKGREA
jgi:hypothetical protein